MKRRAFIGLIGSTAAWPVMVNVQSTGRVRRVGMLMGGAATDPEAQRVKSFVHGLEELGWTEGGNVRVDFRTRTSASISCCNGEGGFQPLSGAGLSR